MRTLQDLVKGTLGFLNSLVILVPGDILLGKGIVDDLETLGKGFHLFFDLPLLLLFLVDQVLDLTLLLIDIIHHFNQLGVSVVQMGTLSCHF